MVLAALVLVLFTSIGLVSVAGKSGLQGRADGKPLGDIIVKTECDALQASDKARGFVTSVQPIATDRSGASCLIRMSLGACESRRIRVAPVAAPAPATKGSVSPVSAKDNQNLDLCSAASSAQVNSTLVEISFKAGEPQAITWISPLAVALEVL